MGMAELEDLKAMRDAAQKRLQSSPDYRLCVSLGKLIGELEEIFAALAPSATADAQSAATPVTPVAPVAPSAAGGAAQTTATTTAGEPASAPVATTVPQVNIVLAKVGTAADSQSAA